ncbi:hypothetical protein RHECNPAF_13600115 [Rhizobium etli CNPAF512]|nr:hypothetical protein RHECNPAF_13600115 [Rhizobium etli CNPAF512]
MFGGHAVDRTHRTQPNRNGRPDESLVRHRVLRSSPYRYRGTGATAQTFRAVRDRLRTAAQCQTCSAIQIISFILPSLFSAEEERFRHTPGVRL